MGGLGRRFPAEVAPEDKWGCIVVVIWGWGRLLLILCGLLLLDLLFLPLIDHLNFCKFFFIDINYYNNDDS